MDVEDFYFAENVLQWEAERVLGKDDDVFIRKEVDDNPLDHGEPERRPRKNVFAFVGSRWVWCGPDEHVQDFQKPTASHIAGGWWRVLHVV